MARGRHHDISANRLRAILGMATILLVVVVAFIAYTANSGLPWESRYRVSVAVPDAQRLIDDADVRIGGVRVGRVLHVTAVPAMPGGRPYARLELALEPSTGPLSADTTAQVRPASVLGLTYVDLALGASGRTIADGGILPLRQAKSTVDLTDLFAIFEDSAGRDLQETVRELSTGLSGRGSALGSTIGSVGDLVGPLTDVARVLAAPQTRLDGFLRAYASTTGALDPVTRELAGLVSGAATTLDAFGRERSALGATIEAAPPAERAATIAFDEVRPALNGLAGLAGDLRPAGRVLPRTLGEINSTLTAGKRPLRELPRFSDRLRTALVAVDGLSRDGETDGSLRKLTDLAQATSGLLSALVPAQLSCNVIGLWGAGFSSVFSALGSGQGPALPNLVLTTAGARNETLQNPRPSSNVGINPIPNEDEQECESGNEPWDGRQQLNNPAGDQSRETRETTPPPGVRELARRVGLLDDPGRDR